MRLITFADTMTGTPTPLIELPSFPVLTSLRIRFYEGEPSRRIVDVLSFISSTPALAIVDIQRGRHDADKPAGSGTTWNNLDGWLGRVAKQTTVECGLVLNLRRWALSESSWETLLPRFMEAGGEIKVYADGWVDYD